MKRSIYYKAVQIQQHYRNTESARLISPDLLSDEILIQAENHIQRISDLGLKFTYPGDLHYPNSFYKMIEPPLFIEYMGVPCWNRLDFISVIGARDCHQLSDDWIRSQLIPFLKIENIGLVSGGAKGIDMLSHIASIKAGKPTVAVLPSGLGHIYPRDLEYLKSDIISGGGALISEFSFDEKIKKSHFYFRNRLIASLGKVCMVVQASLKSGTMLTVHHALQNGKPVITIPSHPGLNQFSGNLKLMQDGAFTVVDCMSLYDFWKAEAWSSF